VKKFLAFLVAALAVTATPVGAEVAAAESALQSAVNDVLGVTRNSGGGRAMADQLQPVLTRHVCFQSMTRRAVGPGWRQFNAEQQAEATKLFTKLIIRSYSEKFTPGQQPEIKYLKASSPGAGKVEIPTSTLYKGSRYTITYRMENRGRWLITDILAEGVSLVANYRAQFDELVKKGGAVAVLDSLKKSVGRT
jgi:phospholipid transport system substrate-binding protein